MARAPLLPSITVDSRLTSVSPPLHLARLGLVDTITSILTLLLIPPTQTTTRPPPPPLLPPRPHHPIIIIVVVIIMLLLVVVIIVIVVAATVLETCLAMQRLLLTWQAASTLPRLPPPYKSVVAGRRSLVEDLAVTVVCVPLLRHSHPREPSLRACNITEKEFLAAHSQVHFLRNALHLNEDMFSDACYVL